MVKWRIADQSWSPLKAKKIDNKSADKDEIYGRHFMFRLKQQMLSGLYNKCDKWP